MEKIKNNVITDKKLSKYFEVTKKALEKVKRIIPKKTHLYKISEDFYKMAETYYNDALFFKRNSDSVNAFAALNYAHGWLDAGARLGLWDVDYDNKLFTVDDLSENSDKLNKKNNKNNSN